VAGRTQSFSGSSDRIGAGGIGRKAEDRRQKTDFGSQEPRSRNASKGQELSQRVLTPWESSSYLWSCSSSIQWADRRRFCCGSAMSWRGVACDALCSLDIWKTEIVLRRFSWQEGFGAFSYSHSQLSTVITYIENQQEHHRRKSFSEECVELLKCFNVPLDQRYNFQPVDPD